MLQLRTERSLGKFNFLPHSALEEPLQSLQAARPQTDDKHKVALQRLRKDEYNLLNLVTCLNDCDPVELVENYIVVRDLVQGSLKRNVAFWEHIGASRFIRDTIVYGYKIPFIYTPPAACFGNNRSAFSIVNLWNKLFLISL